MYSAEQAYDFTVSRFDAFECNSILSNTLIEGEKELLEENGYTVEKLEKTQLGCRYSIHKTGEV